MTDRFDPSERLVAAHRLLSTLRAGRARVEGLASQHLPFASLVQLYDLGLGEDLVDDTRRVGQQVEQQIAAWRLVRGISLASAQASDARLVRAPTLAPAVEAAPPEAGPPAVEAAPPPPPRPEPEPEPEPQNDTEHLHEWDEPLFLGPPSTPPQAAPQAAPQPPPVPRQAEASGFVAFDEDSQDEDLDEAEEEYDPWAARRAALADQDERVSAHPDEEAPASEPLDETIDRTLDETLDETIGEDDPVGDAGGDQDRDRVRDEESDEDRDDVDEDDDDQPVASVRLPPAPRLAAHHDDELDTLNDFGPPPASLDETVDPATAPEDSGAVATGRTGSASPRTIAARLELDTGEVVPSPRLASPATLERVVLSAEQETGSVLPAQPSLPESLTNELDGVPAADDLLLDAGSSNDRAVGSNSLRVGARPTPAFRSAPTSGPQLTDDSLVAEVSQQLDIRPLPEVDQAEVAAAAKEARDAEAKGDLSGAITAFGDAIDLAPDRVEFWLGRGRCHLELGDYSAAMSDFQRSEDLAPGKAEPMVEMGNLYFARKEYSRAIEFYDHAIEIDGALAMARCRRGMCHHYRRNHKAAFQDLQRAYSLDPEIPNIRKYVQMAVKAMERERPGRR